MEAEKFRKVPKPREDSPDDEIRVTNSGRVSTYVTYAARLFNEGKKQTLTVRASGQAIPHAVSTVEILKRRFKGLHQVTTVGTSQLQEEFEPLEEGLEKQIRTRNVSYISIVLTVNPETIDKQSPGYQEPLDESLVRELKELTPGERSDRGFGRNRGRGRGRGMRGARGRGRPGQYGTRMGAGFRGAERFRRGGGGPSRGRRVNPEQIVV